jgi:chromosomal replication initiator protein
MRLLRLLIKWWRLRRERKRLEKHLCREMMEMSLPNIGRHFGGRDHSTVHHGIHNLEALLETDMVLRNRVHRIAARFS